MSAQSLHERLARGRTDLVHEIVKDVKAAGGSGCEPDALKWCAYYGDVTAIKVLLSHGWSLAMLGGNFDLGGAAFHGHWRLCEFLLEAGANAQRPDPFTGETPLHLAASKANSIAHEATIFVLLSAGADPNARAAAGAQTGAFMRDCRTRAETPLHRAAAFGTPAGIDAMISAGADPAAQDSYGETPLSWASWHLRPSSILRKLAYGEHTLHPGTDWSGDHGAGASGMDRNLLGRPGAGR